MKKRIKTTDTSYEIYGCSFKIFLWYICVLISAFSFVLLVSCGSRKVEKQDSEKEVKTETIDIVKKDITIDSNAKIETKIFVVDSTKEEIEETEITPIDNLKPAIFEGKEITNTKVTKRKIKRNKALKSENNTNTYLNEKTTDKTVKNTSESKQTKESNKTKNIDRKQFDPLAFIISYWWLWLILALIYCILKKFKYI